MSFLTRRLREQSRGFLVLVQIMQMIWKWFPDKAPEITQYVWVIDQVWGQDGWLLAKFFFGVFMDRDEVEVNKLATWSNKLGQ